MELNSHGEPVVGSGDDAQVLGTDEFNRIQELGKRDLYFFSRGILGYQDVTPRVHKELCNYVTGTPEELRKLVLMPRSHFKTTVATIADSIREVAVDPNIRILLGNESGLNAQTMLTEIKEHFMNNLRFRTFYPYLIPKNVNETTWSKSEILIPRTLIAREPTISTIGTGGAVVSRHFNLLKFDDLIGEEALHSPAVMEKSIAWLNHSVSLLITPETDRIHLVGTRWAYNDLYAHAMKKMGFTCFRRKAVVLNKKTGEVEPLFKGRFSMKFLAGIIEADPAQWSAQYANDPSDTIFADFKREWLRYYQIAPDGDLRYTDPDGTLHRVELKSLRKYAHVDPSMGETLKSDCSAVIVVGVAPDGKVFVLDAWEQRIDPLNLVEKIFEVAERWDPQIISIESTAFQKSLRYFITDEARKRGTYLRIEDFKPSTKKSKEARIRGALQPGFSTGQYFVRNTQINLIEQYIAFGRTNEDHLMDALAQGPQFWKAPLDSEAIERHHEITRKLTGSTNSLTNLTGYGI